MAAVVLTRLAGQGRPVAHHREPCQRAAADRTVRFASVSRNCAIFMPSQDFEIGKIQHYSTDWNTQ